MLEKCPVCHRPLSPTGLDCRSCLKANGKMTEKEYQKDLYKRKRASWEQYIERKVLGNGTS